MLNDNRATIAALNKPNICFRVGAGSKKGDGISLLLGQTIYCILQNLMFFTCYHVFPSNVFLENFTGDSYDSTWAYIISRVSFSW